MSSLPQRGEWETSKYELWMKARHGVAMLHRLSVADESKQGRNSCLVPGSIDGTWRFPVSLLSHITIRRLLIVLCFVQTSSFRILMFKLVWRCSNVGSIVQDFQIGLKMCKWWFNSARFSKWSSSVYISAHFLTNLDEFICISETNLNLLIISYL